MTQKEKAIEIPFGAKDSELIKWEYTIPEGMEAEIKDGKVIIKKAESEDERIRKFLVDFFASYKIGDAETKLNGVRIDDIIAYLEKQKEQKPAEWEDYKDKVNIPYCSSEPEWGEEDKNKIERLAFLVSVVEEKEMISPSESIDLRNFIKSLRPQQKQEWSEEDEKNLKSVVSTLWFTLNTPHFPLNYDRIIELEGWLKSRRPPLKDRDMKLKILKYLSTRCSSLEFEEVEDYLNNLRPSWKPNEQEKGALRTAIHVLTDERNFPKAAAQLQNILNAFEGKEVRKEWKPSEEQMSALNYFIKLWGNSDDQLEYTQIFITVKSLYEQLKKL